MKKEDSERLVRVETKVDLIYKSMGSTKERLTRLEGRVWGMLILFLTLSLGVVASLLKGSI